MKNIYRIQRFCGEDPSPSRSKTGRPSVPYILNALVNPLLEKLEHLTGFRIDDTHTISSLAFADDLILLADNHNTAETLLTHKQQYLKKLGMSIVAHKCASFQGHSTKDSWYITNMNLVLADGEWKTSLAADTMITYLGGYISAWSGLEHNGLVDKSQLGLHHLRGAFLKPHQNLNLLTTYILPTSCMPLHSLPSYLHYP